MEEEKEKDLELEEKRLGIASRDLRSFLVKVAGVQPSLRRWPRAGRRDGVHHERNGSARSTPPGLTKEQGSVCPLQRSPRCRPLPSRTDAEEGAARLARSRLATLDSTGAGEALPPGSMPGSDSAS